MSTSTGSGIVRRKGACIKCRHRKTRCDGAQPCFQCKKSNLPCSYSQRASVSKTQDSFSSKSHPSRRRLSQEDNWMLQTWDFSSTIPIQLEGSDAASLPFQDFLTSPVQPETSTELDWTETKDPTRSCDETDNLRTVVTTLDSYYMLDHDVQHWPNPEWSSFWAVNMCRDFSTLSPTSSIPSHIRNTTLRSVAQSISARLSRKLAEQCSPEPSSSFPEWIHLEESPLDDLEQTLSYLEAFFEGCYSRRVPEFVNRQDAYNLLVDMTLKPDSLDPCVSIFINSALAIGSRTLSKKPGSTVSGDLTKKSQHYFKVALDCWNRVHGGPAGLGKLQAVSTMALYASEGCDVALTRSLLSEAVFLIQFLMPTHGEYSTSMSISEERSHFKGSFWLIYSLEKPFMMRFGGHSMIDDEMIMLPPPIETRLEEDSQLEFDWNLLHYRYARLCSLIVKTLYGRSAVELAQSDTMANINKLQNALETWRLSIPECYRPLHPTQRRPAGEYSINIRADLQLKHAEAGLPIHRWAVVCPTTLCVNAETAYSDSLQHCIQLAEGLLNGTRLLEHETCSLSWTHLNIPLLAAVIMFIVAVKAESRGEYFAPLGIASGCFGWLKRRMTSSPRPGFHEEVNQLSSMVNGFLYEQQDNLMLQPNSVTPEANQIWVKSVPTVPPIDLNAASTTIQSVNIGL